MEQEEKATNFQAGVSVSTPEQNNVVAQEDMNEKKKGKGMFYSMILLAILAIVGIGFGVWAMMDGNQQKETLNAQNGALKKQISDLQNEIANNNGDNLSNPVIESSDSTERYSLGFDSNTVYGLGEINIVSIVIKNGDIESCVLGNREGLYSGVYSTHKISDCNISGLDGKVYKIVEFGEGHDGGGDSIGFIMTDGQIKYLPLYESIKENDFRIRGTVKVDGRVVDVLKILVNFTNNRTGGYASSVFVLSDGSFVKYDSSMLE